MQIRGTEVIYGNITVGGYVELIDTSGVVNPLTNGTGRLYKSPNDTNLYWRPDTGGGTVPLVVSNNDINTLSGMIVASGQLLQTQISNLNSSLSTFNVVNTPINKLTSPVTRTIDLGSNMSNFIYARSGVVNEVFYVSGGVNGNLSYIAVLSNGLSYSFSGAIPVGSSVTNGVVWPYGGIAPIPSASGRVDLYSFMLVDGLYLGSFAAGYKYSG